MRISSVVNEGVFFDKPSITHARKAEAATTVCGCAVSKYYKPSNDPPDCKRCLRKLAEFPAQPITDEITSGVD